MMPPHALAVPPSTGLLTSAVSSLDQLKWLDDPQEWATFSHAEPDGRCASSVVFEGMHCAACAMAIEDALLQVPGVQSVQISGATHRGRVVWLPERTQPSAWLAAAEQAGYRAVPANDAHAHERRRQQGRRMVWQVSVAGLCMMQVMMYATPAYVSAPGEITPDMLALLRWASWVLTLPVLLFSCAPFFKAAWRDLHQRRISMDLPVALGMLATFVVSSLGTFEPDGPFGAEVYFDSLTMFVFFLLTGRWLELRLRDRTAGALEAVLNRLPDSVSRRTADGQWERVSVRRLAVGDVLEVLPGQSFAGDGTIVSGQTQVDEALLTGESQPLSRSVGERVIAGSHNLSRRVEVRMDQLGAATRYAQIAALIENASLTRPTMAWVADRMAKPFLVFVLLAAALAVALGWSSGPAHAVMVAVAVLVVTCPCALSLATPAAMLATAGALARSGVLVRRLQALQNLAGVDTVVFDKTGTLTRDAFELTQTHVRDGVSPAQALTWAAALARQSLHPVSRTVWAQARQMAVRMGQLQALEAQTVSELSETAGQGVRAVLQTPTGPGLALRLGSASFCEAPACGSGGLQVSLADASGWLATFELQEDVRPEATQVVQRLHSLGLQVRVLSGDSPSAVAQVARAVGVTHFKGACSPQDKLTQMQALQQQGHRVAMVGDGLNDGPVLAGADASFAMGQSVPLALSKADFVLVGAQLHAVADTVLRSRQNLRVVKQNLAWAAVYNAFCVPLALGGWLPAWGAGLGMALSSLLVVLNALRLSVPVVSGPPAVPGH